MIGVYAVSAAFVGWLRGPIGVPVRMATGLAGVALMLPPGVGGAYTLWINGAGMAALVALWLMAGATCQPATATAVSDT